MATNCVVHGFDKIAVAKAIVHKHDQAKLTIRQESILASDMNNNNEIHDLHQTSCAQLHSKGFERWISH